MKQVELKRVEALDQNAPTYKMGREELVKTAMHATGTIRDQAREELARREWNRLVKKARS